jgi:hypothetical protein
MSKSNNSSDLKNKNESQKMESLSIKEQMMGIKSTKPLPKDFYEKVLECEMNLKEKFDMEILGTLIKYYSLAVEHFGSIGDEKKCAEYNENLNLLFKQIEVKKYMNEGNNIESNAKKEEIKKEMKRAEKKITDNTVKSILKEKEKKQTKSGKSVVLKEIFSQTMNFKKKLEEKKKRYKKLNLININTSIIPKSQKSGKKLPSVLKKITEENVSKYYYKSKSSKNKKSKNIFKDMFYELEFSKLLNSVRLPKYSNIFDLFNMKKVESKSILNSNDFSNDESNKNLMDLKNKININEKEMNIKNEINEDDDELILSLESNIGNDSSDLNLNLASQSCKILPYAFKSDKLKDISTKITQKRNFQIKIKENISEYCKGYLDYFMNNVADKIIKEYEKHSLDLSKELINEEINYFNQEKQMAFLIDDDETYKNQIKDILNGLKIEAENKKNELFQAYEKKLNEINKSYSININSIFGCHDIEMLKEKLKLNITKEINNCIFK